MLKSIIYTTILLLSVSIIGCNSCSNEKKDSTEETSLNFESINVIDSIDAIFYALPSPEEIISYINDNQVHFNAKLLNDQNNVKLYSSREKKTIALGVYFADLAYLSAFNKSDFTPAYIAVVNYLLKDLDINPDFTKEQQDNIINASLEPDSLYELSRDLYDTIINYLQEYDEGKTLSLLSVGTLTESLFISSYLHNDFEKQKEAINRIAEQKLLFEDLVTMLDTYKNSPTVNNLIHDLRVLERSFDNLIVTTSSAGVENMEDGSLHVKGKNEFDITEENYFIFSDNIQDFRTRLIRP
jgi:hypothetical protein